MRALCVGGESLSESSSAEPDPWLASIALHEGIPQYPWASGAWSLQHPLAVPCMGEHAWDVAGAGQERGLNHLWTLASPSCCSSPWEDAAAEDNFEQSEAAPSCWVGSLQAPAWDGKSRDSCGSYFAVGGGDRVSALKFAVSAFRRETQALLGGSKAPACHLNISAFCKQGNNLMKHWKQQILPGRLKVRRELMSWVPPGIRESLEVMDKDVLTWNPKLSLGCAVHQNSQVWSDLLTFGADRRAALKGDKFAIENGFLCDGNENKMLGLFHIMVLSEIFSVIEGSYPPQIYNVSYHYIFHVVSSTWTLWICDQGKASTASNWSKSSSKAAACPWEMRTSPLQVLATAN